MKIIKNMKKKIHLVQQVLINLFKKQKTCTNKTVSKQFNFKII